MKKLKTIGMFCLAILILGLWGNNLIRAGHSLFQNISGIELSEYVRWYSILVMRKIAHVVIYFLLYKNMAKTYNYTKALGITMLVAFLDEGLQVFIPGRTASWLDILLDTMIPIIFTISQYVNTGKKIIKQNIKNPSYV